MARVVRFEELEAWQKARELVRSIYFVTSKGAFSRDYPLGDQIRRPAVSLMSNIAEGFERGGDQEFKQFLAIAKGSAGEVRSQLYAALDAEHLTRQEFLSLRRLALESSRLIAGLMRYLSTSGMRGNKFKKTAGTNPTPGSIRPI